MDVLHALEALEEEEKSRKPKKGKKIKSTATKYVNPLASSTSIQSTNSRSGRARESRPKSAGDNSLLSPTFTTRSDGSQPERSPSQASTRRISIVEPPPPPSAHRRVRILTKHSFLGSGFEYHEALGRFGVNVSSWERFSNEIVGAANLSKLDHTFWFSRKGDVARRLKKELMYESSNLRRQLKAWNNSFKEKGFKVDLEVPEEPRLKNEMSEEEKSIARKEAKFFRIVMTPIAERGGSIYSRNSSLSRSVTGEGKAARRASTDDEEDDDVARHSGEVRRQSGERRRQSGEARRIDD